MNAIDDICFKPIRKTAGAIGYDTFACIEQQMIIFPGEIVKIGTGICLDMQGTRDVLVSHFGGFLFPRSSISDLRLTNSVGVIDLDYQGEIIGKFQNESEDPVIINPLDRLLQLLFIPVYLPILEEVEEFENETLRGSGAFGSTGR